MCRAVDVPVARVTVSYSHVEKQRIGASTARKCTFMLADCLQVLAADNAEVMYHGTLLLQQYLELGSPAAALALVQPVLQLLGPAVLHCLQQLQQQQQQQQQQQHSSATVMLSGLQLAPQQAEQLRIAEWFLALVCDLSSKSE
jgi:hypothetical protein